MLSQPNVPLVLEMEHFRQVLDATEADALASLLRSGIAQADRHELHGAKWLCLRAFLTDAANEQCTLNVYYWFKSARGKGVLASQIRVIAGTESIAEHPETGQSGTTFFEADQALWLGGVLEPVVLRSENGQCLIYLPTVEAAGYTLRVADIDTAARVIVLGKRCVDKPPLADLLVPSDDYEVVTPDDDNDLRKVTRALLVQSGAGDLAIRRLDGSDVTFPDVQVGQQLNVRTRRVLSTGTAATGIVALY